MSKIWLFLLIFFSLATAKLIDFDYTHSFNLKKDEIAKIQIIKKDYTTQPKPDGELEFRWTLYHNDLMILLVNYEGFATQYTLKKEYKRDTVRIYLLGDYENIADRVFLILKFSEYKKGTATIEAMIRDPRKRIEVKFIEPRTKR